MIIAEDYLITVSDGRILSREEDLAPIVGGKLQFRSARTDSLGIRVFGNAAIVTGIGIYNVKMGDKSLVIRERFTDVYIKRIGLWQPVSSHSTPLVFECDQEFFEQFADDSDEPTHRVPQGVPPRRES